MNGSEEKLSFKKTLANYNSLKLVTDEKAATDKSLKASFGVKSLTK